MNTPGPPSRALRDLRSLTPARVGLGRSGSGLPTDALLEFTLHHARARDAVHSSFDVAGILTGLRALGLDAFDVGSRALGRQDYLRRPDRGRVLDQSSRDLVIGRKSGSRQLAIVVGDGLSPAAVNAHALHVVGNLIPKLAFDGIEIGHALVARGARVALGDEIGAILGVSMIVMLIGERPGLSTPDSLGAYLTFAPGPGRTDAERNCISNVHGSGLSYDEAAFRIAWLVREGLTRGLTGVALKDESVAPARAISHSDRPDKSGN